jgi:hypothetical protein
MTNVLAAAALSFFVGLSGSAALAQGTAPGPEAEPRNHLSPTDETEVTPRVPPVTTPKPMERTRMGEPVDPARRVAPPDSAFSTTRTAPPRAATAKTVTPRRKTAASRGVVRAPREDERLSTIFTQPR